MESTAREEVVRSNTSGSLVSQFIKARQKKRAQTEHADYNSFNLFTRMGLSILDWYWCYVVGAAFAWPAGTVFPAFGVS
jgi:hypothetical protein